MKTLKTILYSAILIVSFTMTTQAAQPIGDLNAVESNGQARGWAFDPDVPSQSIQVHFYIDIAPESGSFDGYVGLVTTNLPRPDVNGAYQISGNHGFEFPIPERFRNGSPHTLYAYAIDTAGGTNTMLPAKTFNLISHLKYFGYYASASPGDGNGTAIGGFDPDDYTMEIADHSNITWIHGYYSGISAILGEREIRVK